MPKLSKKEKKSLRIKKINLEAEGGEEEEEKDQENEKDTYDDEGKSPVSSKKEKHNVHEENVEEITFPDLLEGLRDKRKHIRCSSVLNVIKFISNLENQYEVKKNWLSAIEDLLSCIHKSDETDCHMFTQCLEILFFVLGDNVLDEEYVQKVSNFLKDQSLNVTFDQSSVVRCLSVLHFVCDQPSELIREDGTMDYFRKHFWKKGPLALAGIRGWCLLLCSLRSESVIGHQLNIGQKQLSIFLDNVDVNIRMMAGEAFGLLIEQCQDEPFDQKQDVLRKVIDISELSSKSVSKKDKKNQRSVFREVQRVIEGDLSSTSPLSVTFGNVRYDFNSMREKFLYEQCKDSFSLQSSAFKDHFLHNELIRDIFEFAAQSAEELTSNFGRKKQSREKYYQKSSMLNFFDESDVTY